MECVICQERFEYGVEYTLLPCGHLFHENCLAPWLAGHDLCPTCRAYIYTNDQESSNQRHQNDSSQIHQDPPREHTESHSTNRGNQTAFLVFESRPITAHEYIEEISCPYCRKRLKFGEKHTYTSLPCGHLAHESCLEPILRLRKCPQCKETF